MRIALGKFGTKTLMALGLALVLTSGAQVQQAEANHRYGRTAAALIIGGIALHHIARNHDRRYYGHHRKRVRYSGRGHGCFTHRHGGRRHSHGCRRHYHHDYHRNYHRRGIGIGIFFGH